MFDEITIQTLQELDVHTINDLWDAAAASPWEATEMYHGFTQRQSRQETNRLQQGLGIESDFTTKWNTFIRLIPKKWWKLMELEDHQVEEDTYFAYKERDTVKYALLSDADLRVIIPCEITTKGTIHKLENISELPEDVPGMLILFDDKNRVIGPAETTYPRWHEWKLSTLPKHKKATSVKIKNIYFNFY